VKSRKIHGRQAGSRQKLQEREIRSQQRTAVHNRAGHHWSEPRPCEPATDPIWLTKEGDPQRNPDPEEMTAERKDLYKGCQHNDQDRSHRVQALLPVLRD
jgi:hypothetical protein